MSGRISLGRRAQVSDCRNCDKLNSWFQGKGEGHARVGREQKTKPEGDLESEVCWGETRSETRRQEGQTEPGKEWADPVNQKTGVGS